MVSNIPNNQPLNPTLLDQLEEIVGKALGEDGKPEGGSDSSQPQAPQPQRDQLTGLCTVRVVFTQLYQDYYLHCLVRSAGITADGLKGSLIRKIHYDFNVKSLREFSNALEQLLEGLDVKFHREPPLLPTQNQALVSYKLVSRANDPAGTKVLFRVKSAVENLYRNFHPDA